MATIREELVLYDRFTNTFTSYIRQGEQAASVTQSAKKATAEFTQSQKTAATATGGLTSKITSLVGAYAGLQGIKSLFTLSDTLTQTTARLDRMNDGLQTTAELNQMIYDSAMRAKSGYQQTADFMSKLGTLAPNAFSSNAELIAFAEQVNKQIKLSGASNTAAAAAMLQLTQGLSSGTLRGEELNSVLEQTPMIAQTIANYLGMTTGQMREFASEGKLSADIVKAAMLGAADETNAAFEAIPLTWGQVWTMAQNMAIKALNPVLNAISWLANNIEIIGPLVLGLAAAFAVFQVAAHWTQIAAVATGAYHFVVNLLSIGFGVLSGSSAAASAAVFTFNSALLASPITWVVMGIMLMVAALYAGVAAFNKLTGSSVSATGIIVGAFATLGAFILNNTIIPLQRNFASFANFLGNLFNDPVAAVKVLFYDLALTVLGYIQNIAHGIENLLNKIPGVEANLTSGIDALYNKVAAGAQSVKDASGWKEYVKAWDYIDLADAFKAGYGKGSNLFSGDLFGGSSSSVYSPTGEMLTALNSIDDSVGGIEKTVNLADEDLKSLVDMAERRYVNNINLTSQAPVIQISGQNTGNTAADRKALANTLRDMLMEQLAAGSTRTTARTV